MLTLTEAQATTLRALLGALSLVADGMSRVVEQALREDFGIADPTAALEDVCDALDPSHGCSPL